MAPSEAAQLDEATIARCLRRLTAAYPAFAFNYAVLGRKGRRWTAERTDRNAPGLRVVITGDLMELHKALQRDKADIGALRYHIEAAEREDTGDHDDQ